MSYDDCEIPEFYAETFPKSRKPRHCCECRAPIESGEVHLYARMKSDGHFYLERQHMVCRELCMAIRAANDECLCFGELKEYVNDSDVMKDRRNKDMRRLWATIIRRERNAERITTQEGGGRG